MDRRDQLLRQYHAFLYKEAVRMYLTSYGRSYGTVDDWYQEAAIALLEADERFDPTRGIKFFTFAHRWVRCRLLTIARNRGSLIRVPAYITDKAKTPKARNVAAAEVAFNVASLADADVDQAAPEEDPPVLDDEQLARLFAALHEREATILRKRYGFDGAPRKLRQLAEELGCSKQWVQHLASRAIDRLERVPLQLDEG